MDEDTRFVRTLFPAAVGGPAILAVSMDAWVNGVRPGMPLAEARSMAQPQTAPSGNVRRRIRQSPPGSMSVEFREWQPQWDRAQLNAVAELTRRFAPIVGLDAVPLPDSLLLDITGCGPLFGGEAGLAESLHRELRMAGWQCRIAIAQTVSAAWALTHVETRASAREFTDRCRTAESGTVIDLHELPIQIIPPGQHLAELSRLPVAASRLGLSDLEILAHLGIRSIGQLLGLPLEDLPSRLSAQAVLRIQQLGERIEELIEPLPEANPVTAVWSAEEPAASLADIRHVLHQLTGQIEAQLVRRRLASSGVTVRLKCSNGVLLPLTASVVKPTQSGALLHEVLCLRLETQVDSVVSHDSNSASSSLLASQPVVCISVTASIVPIPSSRQKDLFSPSEHIVPQEELATLVTRLSNRLGPESVLTVRTNDDPRPEFAIAVASVLSPVSSSYRQTRLDAAMERLTEPIADASLLTTASMHRPLRLLADPQQIALPADGAEFPSCVTVLGKVLTLSHFSGPERIETAWWTDDPCHRDYFQVTAASGNRLWLFKERHTNLWFLHGVFD